MKLARLLMITIVTVIIILANWRTAKGRKEKTTFPIITSGGWMIANLLIWFPHMQDPSEWVSYVFKPLVKLLD